jgi:hypothetical protein
LHLTVALPLHIDEISVVQEALYDHRLALWGLRQHYQGSDTVDGLVLGFSRTAADFEDSVSRLVGTLRRRGRAARMTGVDPRPTRPTPAPP